VLTGLAAISLGLTDVQFVLLWRVSSAPAVRKRSSRLGGTCAIPV
jgi:hypothetical protein